MMPACSKLIAEACGITEDADPALVFQVAALVQLTLPHRATTEPVYTRGNNRIRLSVSGPYGIPYGTIPRLILSWITTTALRAKTREIFLGDCPHEFLSKLGLGCGGDDYKRVYEQMRRLFTCTLTIERINAGAVSWHQIPIADDVINAWHPHSHDARWESTLILSQRFFEISEGAVPGKFEVERRLTRSPFALDVYWWLCWRIFLLNEQSKKKQVKIPWGGLSGQFGATYSRLADFRVHFSRTLKKVLLHYPEARNSVHPYPDHLLLKACPLHVKRGGES